MSEPIPQYITTLNAAIGVALRASFADGFKRGQAVAKAKAKVKRVKPPAAPPAPAPPPPASEVPKGMPIISDQSDFGVESEGLPEDLR
jgi:hypothetical protein